MNDYRVYLEDGTSYVISMNATLEEAQKYFIGQYLNFGVVEDKMIKAIKVEAVNECVTAK